MKDKRNNIKTAIIILILFDIFAFPDDYVYVQRYKDVTYKLSVKITKENDIKTISASDDYFGITNEVKTGKDGDTEWRFIDSKNNSDIKGVRQENKILLTGIYKGKEYKKEHGIDKRPWYQIFTWEFDDFIASGEKEREFWAIRPDNPDTAGVMVVKRGKEEKVTVMGAETEALNIKVTLAGFLSIFWTGDYWYRISDNFYIKAKPSGDTAVELEK